MIDSDAERWMAELGRLRGLVRSLLADEAEVDDVVQDTAVAALQAKEPPREGVAPWATGVARHVARSLQRSNIRRRRREQLAARAEAQPSAAESVQELEAARLVAAAVAGLPEPYRSTVTLRYWEGLPPRKIAAREGVSVRTVDARLYRGLKMIRAKLGDDEPQRQRLLLLAAGVGGRPEPILTAGRVLIGLALVAVGSAPFLLWSEREPAGAGATSSAAVVVPDAAEAMKSAEPSAEEVPRVEVPTAVAAEPLAAPVSWPRTVTVRCAQLLDSRVPVVGAEVFFRGSTWVGSPHMPVGHTPGKASYQVYEGVTGPDGTLTFEVERNADTWTLLASADGLISVGVPDCHTELASHYDVALTAPPRIEATVHSSAGAPLAKATLLMMYFDQIVVDFENEETVMSVRARRLGRTDEQGYFVGRWDVFMPRRGYLIAAAPGHQPVHLAVADAKLGENGLSKRFTLPKIPRRTGRIRSRDGLPLPGVEIVVVPRYSTVPLPYPLISGDTILFPDEDTTFHGMSQCRDFGHFAVRCTTNQDGRFAFVNVSEETGGRIVIMGPEDQQLELVDIDPGEVLLEAPGIGAFEAVDREVQVTVDARAKVPLQISGVVVGLDEEVKKDVQFRLIAPEDMHANGPHPAADVMTRVSKQLQPTWDGDRFEIEEVMLDLPGREFMLAVRIGEAWRYEGPYPFAKPMRIEGVRMTLR